MPAAAKWGVGKWVFGIVTGGIVLGTFLGAAANPEMKQAPAPWWQITGRDEIVVSNMQFVEPFPEDLDVFGGYRPNFDYDAVVWALPIPDYELAALAGETFVAPPAEELPTVIYGVTEAELAAEEAETAAEDAQAAEVAEPAPEAPKSELALAGLY
jgi:hypothetical protein